MKDFIPWEAGAIVQKAYQDDKGRMHVVAIASDDDTDLQSDKMGKNALDKMAEQANVGVPLLDNHKSTFEFGRSIRGAVVSKDVNGKPQQQFVVDLVLDANWPQSQALFKEIKDQRCAKQLSIGGKLNMQNPNAISITMTDKGLVRQINDLDLDHIACTREKHAANPRTGFVSAIMKSLDSENAWDEIPVQQDALGGGDRASKPVEIDGDAEKDAEAGLGLLQKIGQMIRLKNGGNDMARVSDKALVSKTEMEEEESTSEESSISEDTAKKVEDLLDDASPGMAPEEEGESASEWPMDGDAEGEDEEDEDAEAEGDIDAAEEDLDAAEEELGEEEDEDSEKCELGAVGDEEDLSEKGEEEIDIEEDAMGEDDEETTTPVTDAEVEAAQVLMEYRRRQRDVAKRKRENEDEEQMVREIAILLSKARQLRAGSRVEKEALRGALWNVRFLLAKQITEKSDAGGKAEPGAAQAMASAITDGGPYAPTTESAAKGEKVAGDKQQGETDMSRSSVTDANKLPTYAEATQPQDTAPTAGQAAGMMAAAASMSAKLPQMDETAQYGKSLEKSLDSVMQKSLQTTQQMVLKTAEKIVQAQQAKFEEISKRLQTLESAGGVSQAGPRGVEDVAIQKGQQANGVWGGIFGGAPSKATSRM